ncbi:putative Pre-mRNA splicing protein prp5 [Paraphysoderma sedebokerense]|nr:putative Pre-mRNA splicing protein prp5 [Paraphysoderma sedebokerense]
MTDISPPSIDVLLDTSLKRTRDFFGAGQGIGNTGLVEDEPISQKVKLETKYYTEYSQVQTLPAELSSTKSKPSTANLPKPIPKPTIQKPQVAGLLGPPPSTSAETTTEDEGITKSLPQPQTALVRRENGFGSGAGSNALILGTGRMGMTRQVPKPQWHAPWKLMRVISGHLGWVRAITVDVSNEWFVTGAGDRTIKIWDLASGTLKLTLTGHISTVRGLAVSPRHPYLFSCGEDKMVKCWDLEYNKVIRHYHGHLSGVYCMSLHPTLDILMTGGRDSTVRVWDMRTKNQIFALTGHSSTVASVLSQATDPQVISGSMDSTIRCYDLAAGKTMATLTHHKKSVRALALHPTEYSFASASPDNIKQWKLPETKFIQNCSGHRAIVNTLSANSDNVMFSGGDNGSMYFWDWKSGYNFQKVDTVAQPGSLSSEAGIFASTFDRTGSRLFTCEADKTIKVWKEDEKATPETHPIDWKPDLTRTRF